MTYFSFRNINIIAALFSISLIAIAFYFQFVMGLEPCPLCMLQRIIVLVLAITFFIGVFTKRRSGSQIQSASVMLFSVLGVGVSSRQVYLQHLPPEAQPACGPGFNFMFENFPLSETIKLMFIGTGDCAKVQWSFLGFSIAGWMLIIFIGFTFLAAIQLWRANHLN